MTVELTIEVPRNDRGTLAERATAILESIDAVERLRDVEFTGVTPDLNGVAVDATAEFVVAVDAVDPPDAVDDDAIDDDAVRRALDERFGVNVDRVVSA